MRLSSRLVGSDGFTGAALGKPVAVAIHLDDVDVMGQSIKQSGGHFLPAHGWQRER